MPLAQSSNASGTAATAVALEKLPTDFPEAVAFVARHWGWAAAAGVGLLILLFLVVRNWKELRELPGVRQLCDVWSRRRLPKADPYMFTILVARLAGDPDRKHEDNVLQVLREFTGVVARPIDRAPRLKTPAGDAEIQAGREWARNILARTGADVLLWGQVLSPGNKDIPQLCWTSAGTIRPGREEGRYPLQDSDQRLPAMFWEDLKDVLRLLAATRSGEFLDQRGRYVADRLRPFADRVRLLLEQSEGRQEWTATDRARLAGILGVSLTTIGEQAGDNPALEQGIAYLRQAAEAIPRDAEPLDWAGTQNNLGDAYRLMGQRTRDAGRVGLALERHLAAWEVFQAAGHVFAAACPRGAAADLDALAGFPEQEAAACLAQHAQALERFQAVTGKYAARP